MRTVTTEQAYGIDGFIDNVIDNIPDGPYYGDNTLNGETYYIPGNGYIYTDTRANLFYQTRSKYVLQDGKLSKIKQPYQYIGASHCLVQWGGAGFPAGCRNSMRKAVMWNCGLIRPHANSPLSAVIFPAALQVKSGRRPNSVFWTVSCLF